MDTKIDSTHAYMLALILRSSSVAHKLLKLMLMLMLASLVRTGLEKERIFHFSFQSSRCFSLVNV